jgi:DNA-binding GntR family transcriptional regulator
MAGLSKTGAARWLYTNLLTLIEHGAWPDGHSLPSEQTLGALYNLSRTTVRDPIIRMEAIGRVIKHRGKQLVAYMPSKEPHRLVVDLGKPSRIPPSTAGEPEPESAVELITTQGSQIEKRWHVGEYTVPEWDSQRLGIDTGTKLATCRLTLLIDGEPTLIATSLVPNDLPDGAMTWHEAPIGALALPGLSATYSKPTLHGRVPTLDESEALDTISGTPVIAIYRQCQVTTTDTPTPPRSACNAPAALDSASTRVGPRCLPWPSGPNTPPLRCVGR